MLCIGFPNSFIQWTINLLKVQDLGDMANKTHSDQVSLYAVLSPIRKACKREKIENNILEAVTWPYLERLAYYPTSHTLSFS